MWHTKEKRKIESWLSYRRRQYRSRRRSHTSFFKNLIKKPLQSFPFLLSWPTPCVFSIDSEEWVDIARSLSGMPFRQMKEDSETFIGSTKLSEDAYGLSSFLDKFDLPQVVKVVEGFHGTSGNEEETLGAGEIITLHSVKSFKEVRAEGISGDEFDIPLNLPVKFEKIDNRFPNQVQGLKKLLDISPKVKYVRVAHTDPSFEHRVSQGEKLKLKGRVRGDKEDYLECKKINKGVSTKTSHRIRLPLSCKISFQPLEDDKEYLLADFMKKFQDFPALAKAVDTEENIGLLKKATKRSYFGILKLKDVVDKSFAMGTAQEGDDVNVLTIPKELDISITPVKQIETDDERLETRKREEFFQQMESEIYENLSEGYVLRRKHNVVDSTYDHLKHSNDDPPRTKGGINSRNPASPNAYSHHTPKTKPEKHVRVERSSPTSQTFTKPVCASVGTEDKCKKEPLRLAKSYSAPPAAVLGLCKNFASTPIPILIKQDMSSGEKEESTENLYEEIKFPGSGNKHVPPAMMRSHTVIGYAKELQKLSDNLDYQHYEEMNKERTAVKAAEGKADLHYHVANVPTPAITSGFDMHRKQTVVAEARAEPPRTNEKQLQNIYANIVRAEPMAFQRQGKKDYDQTKKLLNKNFDGPQKNLTPSSRSRQQDISSSMLSSTSNAADSSSVLRKRSITPPPVPQRTDSLAAGKENPSSASLPLHPPMNSKETAWSSDEIVVKIFVHDEQPKILDLSRACSYRVSEQAIEKKEQVSHQGHAIPSKMKNEHQVSVLARRRELECYAKSHDASVKQGQGNKGGLDNSKSRHEKTPKKVNGNVAPQIPTKSAECSAAATKDDSHLLDSSQRGHLGVPQRLRERRASCPSSETSVDSSKEGRTCARRGSEAPPATAGQESGCDKSSKRNFTFPKDLRSLNVDEVAQCLEALNMPQYVERFKTEQVDGEILMALNERVLESSLGMEELHRLKLTKFVSGWRPKE